MEDQKTTATAIASPASQEPDNEWIYSNEDREWPEPPPEPVKCQYCGKLRYHKGKELGALGNRIFWIPAASARRPSKLLPEKRQRPRKRNGAGRRRKPAKKLRGSEETPA